MVTWYRTQRPDWLLRQHWFLHCSLKKRKWLTGCQRRLICLFRFGFLAGWCGFLGRNFEDLRCQVLRLHLHVPTWGDREGRMSIGYLYPPELHRVSLLWLPQYVLQECHTNMEYVIIPFKFVSAVGRKCSENATPEHFSVLVVPRAASKDPGKSFKLPNRAP